MKPKSISAEEFDRLFDEGGDISPYLDLSKARRPNLEIKRVNVDLPRWMINAFDREAERLGVTRQSVIKTWLAEKIEERRAKVAVAAAEAPARQRRVAEPALRYRAKKRR
ncbi:MAG: CopG family antitoxin [Alphaproteobacteria bacterium]